MSNIWDTIKRSGGTNDGAAARGGASFTLQFGTETVNVPIEPGMTLRSAMERNASFLGYDGTRALTWRDGACVVAENSTPNPGSTYVASVSMETKG